MIVVEGKPVSPPSAGADSLESHPKHRAQIKIIVHQKRMLLHLRQLQMHRQHQPRHRSIKGLDSTMNIRFGRGSKLCLHGQVSHSEKPVGIIFKGIPKVKLFEDDVFLCAGFVSNCMMAF